MALNFPSSPGIGSVYTDSTSGFSFEWDGTVWKSYSAASSSSIRIIDDISGSFNGIGKTFALTSNSVTIYPKNASSLLINLGGVVQDPFDDYTVSGSNIIFSTAPDAILSFSGIQYGDAIPVTDIVSDAYTRQTYTATSGQTSFNFNAGYTVGFLDVYRNGIKLLPGTDFTATDGSTFVLTDPAVLSDDIEAIGFRISSSTTTEGNITNLTVSGISSLTNLRVTGISTFGISNTLVIDDSGNLTSAAGTITALAFVGDGSGLTGAGSTVADDTSTNETFYPIFTQSTSGTVTATKVSSTKLTYNPSLGKLEATIVNSTSDENLKKDIHTIENALDKVKQLRGVDFNWKDNDQKSIGVVAQELQKVFPELVFDDGENLSVNYNGLIGVLIESIKELSNKIDNK